MLGRLNSFVHVFEHMEKVGCEKIVCYVKEEYLENMMEIAMPYAFVEVKGLEDIIATL